MVKQEQKQLWASACNIHVSINTVTYNYTHVHCWKYSKTTQQQQLSKFMLIFQQNMAIL